MSGKPIKSEKVIRLENEITYLQALAGLVGCEIIRDVLLVSGGEWMVFSDLDRGRCRYRC